MTTFLDKCACKLDFSNRKLNTRSDLIVFIITNDCYDAYTPKDMKTIIKQPLKRVRNYTSKSFVELPSGIMVESSSFIKCFENKVVTFRLKSYNNFESEDGVDIRLSYYDTIPVCRTEIEGESCLIINKEENELETDENEIELQKEKRNELKNIRLKQDEEDEKNSISFFHLYLHGYDIICQKNYVNKFLRAELWHKLKGNLEREYYFEHRSNDLPAVTVYYNNEGCQEPDICQNIMIGVCAHRTLIQPQKEFEKWCIEDKLYRDKDKPCLIHYYRNGSVQSVNWHDCESKNKLDEPVEIEFYPLLHCFTDVSNSETQFGISKAILGPKKEVWKTENRIYRNGDKPAVIEYYRNGNKQRESWYVNHILFRTAEYSADEGQITHTLFQW